MSTYTAFLLYFFARFSSFATDDLYPLAAPLFYSLVPLGQTAYVYCVCFRILNFPGSNFLCYKHESSVRRVYIVIVYAHTQNIISFNSLKRRYLWQLGGIGGIARRTRVKGGRDRVPGDFACAEGFYAPRYASSHTGFCTSLFILQPITPTPRYRRVYFSRVIFCFRDYSYR